MSQSEMTTMAVVLVAIFISAFYFLPTINAYQRKHPQKSAIAVINLFLGWTFIGWVVALSWSYMNQVRAS